jgi:hypothetical protein
MEQEFIVVVRSVQGQDTEPERLSVAIDRGALLQQNIAPFHAKVRFAKDAKGTKG